MNTNKKAQNNQTRSTRQENAPKKRGQNGSLLQDHESPEMRMTR
jgi:hypothetical protein